MDKELRLIEGHVRRIEFSRVKRMPDGSCRITTTLSGDIRNVHSEPIEVLGMQLAVQAGNMFSLDGLASVATKGRKIRPGASRKFRASFPLKTPPLANEQAERLADTAKEVFSQQGNKFIVSVQYSNSDTYPTTLETQYCSFIFPDGPDGDEP